MSIDESSVLSELNNILKSRHFRSRKVLRAFLHYVVMQTLAGNIAKITQYAIAVEGLGKSPDFNSATDPLIRIQAGRLRKLLDEYYASEGRFDPITIELATRGYHATFTHSITQTVYQPVMLAQTSFSLSQGPSIVCIPRTFMSNPDSWSLITRLTRDYVNILTHFNGCQVIFAQETRWQSRDALQQHHTDFALFLDLHSATAEHYRLKCSLIHIPTEQTAWAQSFTLNAHFGDSQSQLQGIFRRIAHDTLGYEQGVAHQVWARYLVDSGKPIAAHYQVMLALRQQLWERSPAAFQRSVKICEQRLAHVANDVQAMIVYADYCRMDYLFQYRQIETLEERLAYITETLLQLAPGNAYSHLYYALSCLLSAEHDACLAALQQAQAINPLDTHLETIAELIHRRLTQEKSIAPISNLNTTDKIIEQ
ncbi:hypothetical protein HMY34_02900 [Thiothrix subterranea]|uniref:hypothetical protein n=1 Tax=Thiothrix subterranea TaxID=2735563 RepID=UPI00192C0A7C|nr:hypothetical protein [Thiothrix subterranea]QQZ27783.1 hypothetical protein HMY34_02900 [Thiothrix subterranea]